VLGDFGLELLMASADALGFMPLLGTSRLDDAGTGVSESEDSRECAGERSGGLPPGLGSGEAASLLPPCCGGNVRPRNASGSLELFLCFLSLLADTKN
jgi:hypothetical protein